MSAKAASKRRKPSLVARLRAYWLAGVVLLALAAWGGWALTTAPAVRLQHLSVTGLHLVSERDVLAHAALDPGANVWLMNAGAVERRIEAIPYVARARVHRTPPGDVRIAVRERTPQACLHDATGAAFTLDASLRVLQTGCRDDARVAYRVHADLAVHPGAFLDDPELTALQRDAQLLDATSDRYRAFAHDAFGELIATRVDGIEVRFGPGHDLERDERLVAPILAELGPRAAVVRAVDLRAPATPVVEYRAPVRRAIHTLSTQYRQGTHRDDHKI